MGFRIEIRSRLQKVFNEVYFFYFYLEKKGKIVSKTLDLAIFFAKNVTCGVLEWSTCPDMSSFNVVRLK